MQGRYQIRLFNTSGAQVAVLDHWDNLEINKNLNGLHDHVLSFDLDDPRVDMFTLDSIVQVLRKYSGGNWYEEYCGFHRTPHRTISEKGRKQFVSYGRSLVDLIRRRTIAYFATTAYTLKSGPGETVIKSYVNENAGPLATDPPRHTDGVTTGLSIEGDLGRGTNWFGQRSYRNLLEVVQEIALATGVVFEVVYTDNATFEFTVREKTANLTNLVFAPEMGNMAQPNYSYSRSEEGTVAIALGAGEDVSRNILVVTNSRLGDSPWNKCEMSVDARQEDTYNGLLSAAEEELVRSSAKENFSFLTLQTPSTMYGRDYNLGDTITARFGSVQTTKLITQVKIQVREHKENIQIGFSDEPI
jgi:hypothetical protein